MFYLIWPLAVIALSRVPKRSAVWILAASWLAVTVARATYILDRGNPVWIEYSPLFRNSGLLMGAIIAVAKPKITASSYFPLILLLLIVLGTQNSDRHAMTVWIPVTEFAAAWVIANPPAVLAVQPLPTIGLLSYGIYLWHFPIWKAIGSPDSWLAMVMVGVPAVAMAALSYYSIEAVFRRRRRATANLTPLSRPGQ